MSKQNFVCTSDEDTANQLMEILHFVQKQDKYWVFVNDNTIRFSDKINSNKLTYTNKLFI